MYFVNGDSLIIHDLKWNLIFLSHHIYLFIFAECISINNLPSAFSHFYPYDPNQRFNLAKRFFLQTGAGKVIGRPDPTRYSVITSPRSVGVTEQRIPLPASMIQAQLLVGPIPASGSRAQDRSSRTSDQRRRWRPVASSSSSWPSSRTAFGGEQNHYEVLGLSRSVTSADIKRAYRLLARKVSPASLSHVKSFTFLV